jgi:hypothetical protein
MTDIERKSLDVGSIEFLSDWKIFNYFIFPKGSDVRI